MSSCKQVRFVHESFCKMQPGIVLMCLHGKQHQDKRTQMFNKFCHAQHAVMFCTDVAARGLDFPRVDWVIQIDCPEDGDTYIHRVGRTARFNADGRALLFLLPSEEEGMLKVLEKKKVPIEKLGVNPKHSSVSVERELQAYCAQMPELKYLGEKALICYLRSVWLNANKEVFDVTKLPIEEYASSLGLPGVPQLKFIRRVKDEKNKAMAAERKATHVSFSDSETEEVTKKPQLVTRVDKMFAKKNQSVLWDHYAKIKEDNSDNQEDGEEEDEDFLKLTRKDHDIDSSIPHSAPTFHERPLSVRDKRNMKVKNRTYREADHLSGTKIQFDDEGTPHLSWKLETEEEFNKPSSSSTNKDSGAVKGGIVEKHLKYISALKVAMKEADVDDKQAHKMRLKEKRVKQKVKDKKKNRNGGDEEVVVTLGSPEEDFGDDFEEEHSDSDFDEKPGKKSKRVKVDETSIEEQEALALKLLNNN